tara:strand:+ start:1639 stop:2136 length:498 start_codon:yes stop_codon:yes gene_type:complete
MSEKVKDYINNVLSERRQEFNNKAVCPFAQPELHAGKLMIATVGEPKDLIQLMREFSKSKYESALFVIKEDVPADQTKKFQKFVNKLLKHEGLKQYKNICFNPNDKVSVDGYNPRSLAPHFLINIADRKVLSKAARAMKKTNYYDKLPNDYLDFLLIEPKQISKD